MTSVAISFVGYTVKAAVFAVIAYAGILCGKKFRDSRTEKLKNMVSEAGDRRED